MIAKIGKVLFAQERISKFKKLANLSFIAGIIMLILYPFLSDNIFIVEKQLKFSEGFHIFQDKEKFVQNSKEFNERSDQWFTSAMENHRFYYKDFFNNKTNRKALFSEFISEFLLSNIHNPTIVLHKREVTLCNENFNNEVINSIRIKSQRGDFSKGIIVNFIYDSDRNPLDNSFHLVYSFLKNFENHKFYYWMSKDLLINFISKDLFYNEPKKLVKFIKNDPIINEVFPEFFINIDLTSLGDSFTRSSFFKILMKINGVNSENIDMDFYKLFFDNFSRIINDYYSSKQFSIKTFENKLEKFSNTRIKSEISYIKKYFLNKLSSIFDTKSIRNSIVYRDLHEFYSYFFNNVIENYLNFQRKIDANDILISEGKISILIKIISDSHKKTTYEKDFYLVQSSYDNNMINLGFNVFCVLERTLKNLNRVEIDIFRGDHNYLLTNNNKFQGTGLFILIPVLCVIRIFYEILQKFYNIAETENEIFESIKRNKQNLQKASEVAQQEIESKLKYIFLKDKLANFASFQIFIVLLIISFFGSSELLNSIFINKDEDILFKYIGNLFSKLDLNLNDNTKMNVSCCALLILFTLISLIKMILKKILSKNNNFEAFNSEFNCPMLDCLVAENMSSARKKVYNEITNITNLFYLGLNLFLIFFINYPFGFIYIFFLMIPEFIIINIDNLLHSILIKKSNQDSNYASLRLSISNRVVGLITFIPIIWIFYMDSSNEVKDYLFKTFLNEDANNSILKFLYLDIFIFYCLKMHCLLDF